LDERGLAKVTPGPDGLKVRIYTTADGLLGAEFNQNAFHKATLRQKELTITLRDDGIGFEQDKASNGYGLKNMAARAKKIGGFLQIHGNSGSGTVIQFRTSLKF